jgi:hypothetical protein
MAIVLSKSNGLRTEVVLRFLSDGLDIAGCKDKRHRVFRVYKKQPFSLRVTQLSISYITLLYGCALVYLQ